MSKFVCKHYHKFDDDCADFLKKCPSIKDDLEIFKTALIDDITINNGLIPRRNNSYIHVKGLRTPLPVFKVKKFRCRAIPKGNRSGFRLIFAYDRSISLIYFIEFYYKKNDNTDMDRVRATRACNHVCNQ